MENNTVEISEEEYKDYQKHKKIKYYSLAFIAGITTTVAIQQFAGVKTTSLREFESLEENYETANKNYLTSESKIKSLEEIIKKKDNIIKKKEGQINKFNNEKKELEYEVRKNRSKAQIAEEQNKNTISELNHVTRLLKKARVLNGPLRKQADHLKLKSNKVGIFIIDPVRGTNLGLRESAKGLRGTHPGFRNVVMNQQVEFTIDQINDDRQYVCIRTGKMNECVIKYLGGVLGLNFQGIDYGIRIEHINQFEALYSIEKYIEIDGN